MAPPRSLHLRGRAAFARFDHDATTIDVPTETIRLATREQGETDVVEQPIWDAWLAARGGAAVVPCPPDRCDDSTVLLLDRSGELFALGDGTWQPVRADTRPPAASNPLQFAPISPVPAFVFSDPRALSKDPHGRLWLLERGASRVLLFADDDLRWLDTVPLPPGAKLLHLACGGAGVIAIAGDGKLFFQPYGGEWSEVPMAQPLPASAVPVAVAAYGDRLAALYRLTEEEPALPKLRAVVALIEDGVARLTGVPGLEDPLPFLALPNGDLLIGEVSGDIGSPMLLTQFLIDEHGRLATRATLGVRSFDGRALFLDACGEPAVTTKNGVRSLFVAVVAPHISHGGVETFALDSERYGNVWHRVFIEACVPDGTSIEVAARTSDDITPIPLRRDARAPAEGGLDPLDAEDADRFALGSRTPDDVEGWAPLGALDRRAAWADVPFAPPAPSPFDTFEGLVKAPPGRYLWLRVTLRGAKRKTPVLHAIRATYPRPSILDHLPAFWRNDPARARAMEEVLALFEGLLTELDVRIDALPRLFDPRSCPNEALDWLASFIALSLDPRLDEPRRRALVREGARLFRQRGTLPGLTRLLTIIAGARVDIVEAFRQRPKYMAILGQEPDAVLNQSLALGGDIYADNIPEWETRLAEAYKNVHEERERILRAGKVPCPPEDPPDPLAGDALIALCRRYAHRFTVVVFRSRDDELADILETAIERNKPAHTVHDVCWQGAGFCLGVGTYIGFGTRLGDSAGFRRAITDQSVIGSTTVLSQPGTSRTLGMFTGTSKIGRTSHLL